MLKSIRLPSSVNVNTQWHRQVFDSQKYELMTEAQNKTDGTPSIPLLNDLEEIRQRLADHPHDATLMIEQGKLLWKLGRRGEAISAYEAAAAIDPDGPARMLIEHSNAIMDFFNPDLLNP